MVRLETSPGRQKKAIEKSHKLYLDGMRKSQERLLFAETISRKQEDSLRKSLSPRSFAHNQQILTHKIQTDVSETIKKIGIKDRMNYSQLVTMMEMMGYIKKTDNPKSQPLVPLLLQVWKALASREDKKEFI